MWLEADLRDPSWEGGYVCFTHHIHPWEAASGSGRRYGNHPVQLSQRLPQWCTSLRPWPCQGGLQPRGRWRMPHVLREFVGNRLVPRPVKLNEERYAIICEYIITYYYILYYTIITSLLYYYYIIITSLLHHYYHWLLHIITTLIRHYYIIIASLLRHYYVLLLRHYYVIITLLLHHYCLIITSLLCCIITSLLRHYYIIITSLLYHYYIW